MDQTDGTDGSVDIGVSLSGGGHRATLFGLGVLLYLAHAHDERDEPLSRRVSAISSVSGGSIANGFLAQSLDYRCAEGVQVEVAAQTLATQLAEHGVLFARRRVKAYAIALGGLATLGEIFSLRKLSNLPYSTREANTRRALEWRFRAAPDLEPQGWPRLRGTLVHIEESPAELADEIQLWLRDWEWQSTPPGERSHLDHPYGRKRQVEFLFGLDPPPARWVTNFLSWSERYDASGRAEAVLEVLARAEPDTANVVTTWRERAARNAAMRTTLSRVPPEVAAQLIEHGYALAMARLHILQGYPLVDLPPRGFFRRLAGSEAARAGE